ncbi:hypothetical protein HRE53_30215 (plasmid) [Acaryochloris sp. 'Moss Beach']|uniref:hypothetical protein n=1 Tax=Acaryochloris sp. 'Moss Beach' TaxID=2740837 RepID=UPI001F32DCE1|nr:hypothetical protein [Acaryochloris sp. 'Moss Beach']UJB73008.1 hypothetical protein HRE53_30215 [Acaryochloris sp. 'Moss Beach']
MSVNKKSLENLTIGKTAPDSNELLAATPLSVRLPASLDQIVRQMKNKPQWLRSAIVNAAIADESIDWPPKKS